MEVWVSEALCCTLRRARPTGAMSWEIFEVGRSASEADRPTSLLPRAIVHPHFTCCSGVWPDHEADVLEEVQRAETSLRECSRSYGASYVAWSEKLRTSSGVYAREAALALAHARCAFAASNVVLAARHGRSLADLCAAQLEEGDWDDRCWQEANLFGLAYQLAHAVTAQLWVPLSACGTLPDVARGGVQRTTGGRWRAEAAADCGRLAIALFNMAVVAGASGSPISKWQPWLGLLLSASEQLVARADAQELRSQVDTAAAAGAPGLRLPSSVPSGPLTPQLGRTLSICSADDQDMSCARFFQEHLQPARPVLIRGHLESQGWAALDYFGSLDRLRSEHGHRLVPVNLGSPLVGYRGVVHMSLCRLIDDHLAPSIRTQAAAEQAAAAAALERGTGGGGPPPDEESHCNVAYMSQHHLLHQVPQLRALIAVPPFLLGRNLSPVNVWLGTRGTVTSLHSDPDDNLLCQARRQHQAPPNAALPPFPALRLQHDGKGIWHPCSPPQQWYPCPCAMPSHIALASPPTYHSQYTPDSHQAFPNPPPPRVNPPPIHHHPSFPHRPLYPPPTTSPHTSTPTHVSPRQVAGYKYVRLYRTGPAHDSKLYAHSMRAKGNNRFGTSPVRVEAPDTSAYPLFLEAEYDETILGPGDMLYIPRSHWHYVRALSTSVSINFWF